MEAKKRPLDVSVVACDQYEPELCKAALREVLAPFGGLEFIKPGDRILIVDDFLATGAALVGLSDIVKQAGATLVGVGIAVEKAFQGGGDKLRAQGMRIESLARIAHMSDDSISFC